MTETQQWICTSCGFIYDPEEGDPDGGIPPGTAFTDIPDDWFCPVCGARSDVELDGGLSSRNSGEPADRRRSPAALSSRSQSP